MNIAHILPNGARFPLQKHNGRYEWVMRLATLQAQHGHVVTIYCGPDSTSNEPSVQFSSLLEYTDSKEANNLALFQKAFHNSEHQIYHSHFDYLHYQIADATTKPVVVTQHWFPSEKIAAAVPLNTRKNVTMVPVTNYMAREDLRLGIPAAQVIYHGVDLATFRPSFEHRSDRLLFVGRITPQKGVKEAVAMALAAGANLDMVGKINNADQTYWEAILPNVDGEQICHLGSKNRKEVAALMAQAKSLVFLPQGLEAFGQTIIEAQACGTPVITNNLGAASELIQDNQTGFIIGDEAEFIHALQQCNLVDPLNCRKFAKRFDQISMMRAYDDLYQSLLDVTIG